PPPRGRCPPTTPRAGSAGCCGCWSRRWASGPPSTCTPSTTDRWNASPSAVAPTPAGHAGWRDPCRPGSARRRPGPPATTSPRGSTRRNCAPTRTARSPPADTHRLLFERLGGHTAVAVPLRARRRPYGLLTVARASRAPAPTGGEMRGVAVLGGGRALVLATARLYHGLRYVAETMQRRLLAPLPQVDHLRMDARYVPAQGALEVGVDGYDAFLPTNGVMALVV